MKKIVVLSLLLLSACAQFGPFVDARREAGREGTVGQSTPNRIAVCYNPLWSDMKKVEQLAKEGCAQTKRKAQADGKKYFNCSFFSPSTAFYKCI